MDDMEYISGMKIGNLIADFLKRNNKYNPKNYKNCYEYCKTNCKHISNGKTGKASRYLYFRSDVNKYISEWYNKHTV